jgi:hypothetical protein
MKELIFCPETKTHLCAFVISNIFPGVISRTPFKRDVIKRRSEKWKAAREVKRGMESEVLPLLQNPGSWNHHCLLII